MTRDDIIRMAREAGLLNCDCCLPFWEEDDQENWKRFFVNFAALVAAAEREACAKVCEEECSDPYEDFKNYEDTHTDGWMDGCNSCAAAIRARGETK